MIKTVSVWSVSRNRVITTILLTSTLAVAGCSGNDGEEKGRTDAAGNPGAAADPGRVPYPDRLALLPRAPADGTDGILITMGDLDAAAKAARVSPPSDVTDQAAVAAYAQALQGVAAPGEPALSVGALLPERIGSHGISEAAEFEAELGWSVVDLRWFVEHSKPPVTLTVLGGAFTEQRLAAAMGKATDGRWRVGAGEDLSTKLDQRSAARPLGRPLTLALDSGRLFVADTAASLEAAAGADGDRLGDVPELRALAEAMEAEGAYATMLSAGGRYQVGQGRAGTGSPLRPFIGVGTGLAFDEGKPYLLLAYAHADSATATANATALRTHLTEGQSRVARGPWSERLTVGDIRVDGTTLVARLALGDTHPNLAWQLLIQRDPLVRHGG